MTGTLPTSTVNLDQLRPYHRNPRRHDDHALDALRDSLRTNGQYRPIVVNRGTHTGRPHETLCGNHTVRAARDLGWTELVACHVDVNDDQAARIVAADNRTADLGSYDDRQLAELLSALPDLDGTGYGTTDLDDLLALVEEQAPPEPPPAPAGDTTPADPPAPTTGGTTEHQPADTPPAPTADPPAAGHAATQTRGIGELRESYALADHRRIQLVYSGDQYVWVVDTLARLGDDRGTDNHSDTVLALLEEITGDTAPGR